MSDYRKIISYAILGVAIGIVTGLLGHGILISIGVTTIVIVVIDIIKSS